MIRGVDELRSLLTTSSCQSHSDQGSILGYITLMRKPDRFLSIRGLDQCLGLSCLVLQLCCVVSLDIRFFCFVNTPRPVGWVMQVQFLGKKL